jgi:hypothetical protein
MLASLATASGAADMALLMISSSVAARAETADEVRRRVAATSTIV